MNYCFFLEEQLPKPPVYETSWYIGMTILLLLLITPWIYLIVKYCIFRTLRVRFILEDGKEFTPLFLKKGATIPLPNVEEKENYTFDGWYRDMEFTKKFNNEPMPNENIKLFGRYVLNNQETKEE